MKKILFAAFILISIISCIMLSSAQSTIFSQSSEEENDILIGHGIELDNVITLVSSILSFALFILTYIAYRRDGRDKLVYVAVAFLLFAVKGVLSSLDIFVAMKGSWVDPFANLLDLITLLCFFVGIVKK